MAGEEETLLGEVARDAAAARTRREVDVLGAVREAGRVVAQLAEKIEKEVGKMGRAAVWIEERYHVTVFLHALAAAAEDVRGSTRAAVGRIRAQEERCARGGKKESEAVARGKGREEEVRGAMGAVERAVEEVQECVEEQVAEILKVVPRVRDKLEGRVHDEPGWTWREAVCYAMSQPSMRQVCAVVLGCTAGDGGLVDMLAAITAHGDAMKAKAQHVWGQVRALVEGVAGGRGQDEHARQEREGKGGAGHVKKKEEQGGVVVKEEEEQGGVVVKEEVGVFVNDEIKKEAMEGM
ncbi:unnamed protein product [Closterium sp. Naga37s-1]|nr:unnamed protein product [Closterium sp. Naga37s-1]